MKRRATAPAGMPIRFQLSGAAHLLPRACGLEIFSCVGTLMNLGGYQMGLTGWRLLSLICATVLGGYALATAAGVFLGGVLPLPRGEAALVGNLLSFVVYVGAAIWAFTVRRPGKVWLGLVVPACVLAGVGLWFAGRWA